MREIRSPKSEVRSPKEIRNPKSEAGGGRAVGQCGKQVPLTLTLSRGERGQLSTTLESLSGLGLAERLATALPLPLDALSRHRGGLGDGRGEANLVPLSPKVP